MSRGPGRVERAILRTISEQPVPSHIRHRYWLFEDLGPHVYGDAWAGSAAQLRSLQRAVRKLWLADQISTGVQRGGRGHKVVVFPPDRVGSGS